MFLCFYLKFVQPYSTPSISMPNSGSGPKRSIFDEEDLGNVPRPKIEGQQQQEKIVGNINLQKPG